ncbi:hypothetical protein Ae201684P_010953 [Aphanomyces euteiches]|nr:hypothetical protein Ae201684P_010953 [Aphanomyces euteiches]KAH9146271.1 hypothetical protein AeRB84_009858 [Aphanomyces euteiches]
MLEVGFWKKYAGDADDKRPHPAALQDIEWYQANPETAHQLIKYVRYAGCVESYEMGYSFCRIDPSCPSKTMGACTLTDGVYCWPEGYAHYLEAHHVRPPSDFLEHVQRNSHRGIPNQSSCLLMWDYEQSKPVPMPLDMQTMILANTTLRLGSEGSSDSTKSCSLQ